MVGELGAIVSLAAARDDQQVHDKRGRISQVLADLTVQFGQLLLTGEGEFNDHWPQAVDQVRQDRAA